ncbi:unnamed protein product [Ectocarpus sp. 6 AP-2014]
MPQRVVPSHLRPTRADVADPEATDKKTWWACGNVLQVFGEGLTGMHKRGERHHGIYCRRLSAARENMAVTICCSFHKKCSGRKPRRADLSRA